MAIKLLLSTIYNKHRKGFILEQQGYEEANSILGS
jgi:hypothetical protein